jgi:hypothetical protein
MNKIDNVEQIENLIKENMWGLRCDYCTGGGWDYDEDKKCTNCGGCGIYDWRIEPLVSLIKQKLLEVQEQERERCYQIAINTKSVIGRSPLAEQIAADIKSLTNKNTSEVEK